MHASDGQVRAGQVDDDADELDSDAAKQEAEDTDAEAHLQLMKNLGGQFGEEDKEQEQERDESQLKASRPADVVLEHANDTYTQRFCAYSVHVIPVTQTWHSWPAHVWPTF